ncbi:MAG: phosphoribosylanthranilate isomerase [Bacteroidia bacterium]|nr:phosphoribosylanthranilate isomerase [Bacteroidia bacterium]
MRNQSNIEEVVKLKPDYIGFIFYPKSKRFIGEQIPDDIQTLVPVYIQKVGVFVDEPFDNLLEKFRSNKLDMIQLHGSELPGYCERLMKLHIPVIKVFSIDSGFNFETVEPYELFCNYYLFDTAGELRGGTGIKFDWKKLDEYTADKPFFLSGGIQPTDVAEIKAIKNNKLHAIDVNSGFEIEPGVKDIPKLKTFIDRVRDNSGQQTLVL